LRHLSLLGQVQRHSQFSVENLEGGEQPLQSDQSLLLQNFPVSDHTTLHQEEHQQAFFYQEGQRRLP